MSQFTTHRLHVAIAAVAPIVGVSIIDEQAKQARIDYAESATGADKVNGAAALATFNWSDSEDAPFQAQEATAQASNAIDEGVTQKGGPVDRLTVAITLVAMDGLNANRTALAAMNSAVQAATSLADLKTRFAAINFPSQVTPTQVLTAVKTKLGTLPT